MKISNHRETNNNKCIFNGRMGQPSKKYFLTTGPQENTWPRKFTHTGARINSQHALP